jgi:predicted dithiol-disulfide oxidoreductase (DUF899 family)
VATNLLVSREDWLHKRLELLAEEKAMTRALDTLAEKRRALPWVAVEKDYRFQGPEGTETLSDLFSGCKQLVIYHFMYGPDWQQGCPSCSFWADNYNGLDIHLAHRNTTLLAVSNTSLQNIETYRSRMGWQFKWVSSLGSEFNYDFNVSFRQEDIDSGTMQYNFSRKKFPSTEAPGLSTFIRTGDGGIAHTYSCFGRGLDIFNSAYQILDMTALGRHEGKESHPMSWVRRHDQYGE